MRIIASIYPLYSYYIIKARKLVFLILINNLLLIYLSKFSIFNLINIFSILIRVAAAAVTTAAFAATEVYEVVITYIKVDFFSLLIIFFISWSCPFISLLYLFLSCLISLITVFN